MTRHEKTLLVVAVVGLVLSLVLSMVPLLWVWTHQ